MKNKMRMINSKIKFKIMKILNKIVFKLTIILMTNQSIINY